MLGSAVTDLVPCVVREWFYHTLDLLVICINYKIVKHSFSFVNLHCNNCN